MNDKSSYRFFDILVALFVAVLLISNIASTKILTFWKFTFDGGTMLFPLSYIFGDILTEVYGFRRSRRVIWLGFFSALLMSLVLYVVQSLPPAADWPNQQAFETFARLYTPNCAGQPDCLFHGRVFQFGNLVASQDKNERKIPVGAYHHVHYNWGRN